MDSTQAKGKNGGENQGQRMTSPLDPLAPEIDHAMEELRGRLDEAAEQAARFIRARPGTSLLLALGAGYLVGRLVRS
jgi:hypothetical protein